MARPPRLALGLLGPPLVEVEGRPLSVDTRKATALLAFLAVEDRAVRRDTLAARFWPEAGPDRARGALRRTLSTLKAALDADRLEIAGETVMLRKHGLELDIVAFRDLVAQSLAHGHDAGSVCDRCLTPLRAAVELHRGQFLAGFGLRDAPDFDDWQQLVGDELRRELAAALDRLATAEAAAGSGPAAIAQARRRLALDPLHEPAHRHLMELYANEGDRSAALNQYRECVRILHRELGVAPLETTTTLYRSIREGTLEPVVQPEPARPAAGTQEHPLVGRQRQWRALLDAYADVGPDGRLVVLEGEAGIGKTRLGGELLAWARLQGAVAIGVRSFEDEERLAFGSMIELLRGALREGSVGAVEPGAAAEAARLLPELGTPPTPSLDDPGAQARFFEGLTQVLLSATLANRPAVVLADDVHWADASSLDVLAYLARRLRGRPILVVVTWRPEETPPGHPARRVLAEAVRDGRGSTVTLGRLAREEVGELVAAAGAPDELTGRLFEETHGLPFFVVEYLDSLNDGVSDWPVPAGVRELLETRLAATSEIGSQVVAAAAVLGRAFDADTVRDVSGRSDEETVAALEELSARGIVIEVEGAGYDFRHEQGRKVAYERTSVGRRRLLHRRAGETIAARARGGAAASVVGQHLRLGGRDGDAAEWFRLAGEHARSLYANAEALAHFREALALGHPDPAELHEAIGDLQTLAGDYAGALSSYEAAAAHADPEQVAAIEHRIGLVHHRRGEWDLADGSFAEALVSLPPGEGAARARIVSDQSLTAHSRGRDDEAQVLAAQALALADEAGDRRALAQAHNILGILAASRGELDEARGQLEMSLALADAQNDPSARAAALNNLALAYRADGDFERALELTEEALAFGVAVGDRHREAALANNAADLLHAAGRHGEAMERLKSAVAIFAEIGEAGVMEPEIWKLVEW